MLSSRSARFRRVIHWIGWKAFACPPILVALGCSTPPRPATAIAPKSSCVISAAAPTPAETISVAVTGPIDPARIPTPANSAERFVFAQLYETLIDIDCEGHAYPGLASSWTLDATRTRVTLVIRDDARFWNGKPVTASDVVAAWRATGGQSTESSRLVRRLADAATVDDDRALTVSLPDSAWLVLADPALAISQPQPGSAWAQGSGSYRVDSDATVGSGLVVLVPFSPHAAPPIVARNRPSADPRDAIDAGADLIVTSDAAAVSYAATRANLSAVPLPWNRAYVLAVPGFIPDSARASLLSMANDPELRASLAGDAVHAEARPAAPPYWWSGIQGCTSISAAGSAAGASGGRPSRRIVYRRNDGVARGLAERLVAVGRGMSAAGLAPSDFARALRDAQDLAYVFDLPRASLSPCQDLTVLVSAAPWLTDGAGNGPSADKLLPLIDTRARAIVNRDHVSAMIDWDGTLRIAGRSRQP